MKNVLMKDANFGGEYRKAKWHQIKKNNDINEM